MAKFYGAIGYAKLEETAPGVHTEVMTERMHRGDVIRNMRRLESIGTLNDNVAVSNSISIVADPYANEHFFAMRYIEWMGTRWAISNVDVQRPRLILTLGGVYNVKAPSTP